jgi:CheY-like chemotaxis protein/Tfp pilus assembly protein PilZ
MSASPIAKAYPKIVAASIDDPDLTVLRECFGQNGFQTAPLPSDAAADQLKREKFAAIVVNLNGHAETVIEAARSSSLNRCAIMFGVAEDEEQISSYFKHGLNAMLKKPLTRIDVIEAIGATHRLLSRELRCYARVPLITSIDVTSGNDRFSGVSSEMSAGGMALKTAMPAAVGQKVSLSFALPRLPQILLTAVVSWTQAGQRIGVRFDRSAGRDAVRSWVEEYLDMS